MSLDQGTMEIIDCLEDNFEDNLANDIKKGLASEPKSMPSKYFYDQTGSMLFENICALPEYYLTRTEVSLLKDVAPMIMSSFPRGDIVELGAGANRKIRLLLDSVEPDYLKNIRYIPVDVSSSAISESAEELLGLYPGLAIKGIIGDFVSGLSEINGNRPKLIIFLGNTIGNLEEERIISFLRDLHSNMTSKDRLLIGFDMEKPVEVLEDAYNDSLGVTKEFNKNILAVINKELNANFDKSKFQHVAFYNDEKKRIEMHLKARADLEVSIGKLNLDIKIDKGEMIHTENSRKFTDTSIRGIAEKANLQISQWHRDSKKWFSLVEFIPR